MNKTIEELYKRKSVRVFEDRAIGTSEKDMILEAAFQAPTAGNMMLYSILDITDSVIKQKLSVTCDNQPFIAKSPMLLIFLADYQKWIDSFQMVSGQVRTPEEGDFLLAVNDALIAAQNAVTAAWALGIGSCYIGDILEHYETHRNLFALPRYVMPAAMVCFGYPTKQQGDRQKPVRFKQEYLVSRNSYQLLDETRLREMFSCQNGKCGKELDQFLKAFCNRKYESAFSREMSRSVRAMLNVWTEPN